MPIIPILRKLRQEDHEVQASLGSIVRPSPKKKEREREKQRKREER
jgi:hypothetical protein